ncbi:MAG: 4Fe-4S dicluster domain-containing protein [Syntrophomonadaceae bacterium]|jgi:Fe-S oxidoreductase/nitrate reductase gamma subunit|nr:4Fe-4S dicluster domain-containing protein [Syntrophomonadaceae bacterium]
MNDSYHPIEGGYEIPMRVVGANIPYEWLIYILMLIPIGILIYGVYRRIRIWRLGQGEQHRIDRPEVRIWSLISNTLAQKQLIRKPVVGWMHFFLFWGFIFLFLATVAWAMWSKINFPPMVGNTYIIASAIVDITGFLALIGILVLAITRYIVKPDRLNDTLPLDGWILLLIFTILFTGYIIEGARIAAQIKLSTMMTQIIYEKSASPIGWIFAVIFNGSSVASILLWHRFLWWFHMTISFIFIAAVPFTKLWHIFTGMIAYYVRDLEPSHIRMVYNMEAAESFGVENIEEFGWKDLMDLDACIRCGRCQEACPAYNTGKLLNPKITLIQAMKEHLDKKAPYLLKSNPDTDENLALTDDTDAVVSGAHDASLIYDVVTPDVLWSCTNCRGCVYHCPMFIEHIDKITDMRRNLVMWQGDMPGEAQSAFTNLERNYNPWGVGWASRADWLQERGISDLVNILPEDGQEFEYLLFGGCAVAFDDRFKRVGEALVKILHRAGVSFSYLGTQEHCCGDSARRLGNEYLYQSLALHNIEAFNSYGVKKIICICPHGYNVIKNEYPQMDGKYEVYHYTEILQKLLAEGKLETNNSEAIRLSYHDSCFLGRHNGIYQAPRDILEWAGGSMTSLDTSRQFGFCCGAGGGRMWLEEEAVEGFKRINEARAEQLMKPDPQVIATNCPFCLTMISDGVKASDQGESIKVMDVAEILLSTLN